jgi:hypothetical protein
VPMKNTAMMMTATSSVVLAISGLLHFRQRHPLH